jgi:transcriptional regulator with XRE-family HTH domain
MISSGILHHKKQIYILRNMNLIQLSQRIRLLRVQRGFTLEQVSEMTGLTRGVLSKVENFRVTPSLATLSKIAGAFGVSMSELFEGLDDKPEMVVVRKDERLIVERDRPDSAIVYQALAHKRPNKIMEPFLLEVPPGEARRQKLAHEGEEFLMVLKGTVDYEYGDQRFRLEEGDCLYEDGTTEHTLNNPQNETALVLCIYATGS